VRRVEAGVGEALRHDRVDGPVHDHRGGLGADTGSVVAGRLRRVDQAGDRLSPADRARRVTDAGVPAQRLDDHPGVGRVNAQYAIRTRM
jgi:hypothetical protein